MINSLNKLLPNLFQMTEVKRTWTTDQQDVFDSIKEALISPPVLKYYSVNEDVIL